MRDVILFSGWRWETYNAPERVALAFAHVGAKVLYCENPVSRFLRTGRALAQVVPNVYACGPEFWGHRLNAIPGMPFVQSRLLSAQITSLSRSLGLRRPVFVYPHLRNFTNVCRAMKQSGFPLVHLCIDYPEPFQEEQIAIADRCLVIPPAVFLELRQRYGSKVFSLPQLHSAANREGPQPATGVLEFMDALPHPRLVYLGPAADRLDLPLVEGMLRLHPEWQFVTFGEERCLSLPNVHAAPWFDWRQIPEVLRHCDLGFMPYERHTQKNLQCVPLKLFDYFAAGLPVVSTPILYLKEVEGLVYVGDSPASLSVAVQQALKEPKDASAVEHRKRIAQAHSVEVIAKDVADMAGLYLDELPNNVP